MTTRNYGNALAIAVVMATIVLVASSTGCPGRCQCRQLATGGTAVDCRHRNLTSIVPEIPSDTVELDFGGNPLTSISRSSFPTTWSRLRRLSLDGCQLERLERMTFRHLQLLEFLDLSANGISFVDVGAFQGIQYLRDLNLDNNSIASPPGFLFRGLNLSKLHFSYNGLGEIPDDLFGAAKIASLHLDHNSFSTLTGEFLRPIEASLRKLSISNNQGPLTLDEDMFPVVNLHSLSLVSSRLSNTSFLPNTKADRIDLSGNRLGTIALQQGTNLAEHCKELILRDTALESIDESLTANLQSVHRLDLSGNLLVTFKPDIFRFTQHLRVLDLSRNQIVRLPDGFGPQMHSLQSLNLSNCRISSVNWEALRSTSSLKTLDLSGNRLQVIPQNASTILDNIDHLKLSQNLWHCNCEMRWFRQWLAEDPKQLGTLRCTTPTDELMLNLAPREFVCTAPQVTNITKSKNIPEGSAVHLSCAAQSDPAPAIVWRAPFGDVVSVTPPENRTRTKTIADWTIHQIKPHQSGWYSCNSTNLIQSEITYTYLQVTTSPDEALDLTDLVYPMIPSKPLIQTTTSVQRDPIVASSPTKDVTTTGAIWNDAPQRVTTPPSETTSEITTETERPKDSNGDEDYEEVDEVDGYWTSEEATKPFSSTAESSPPPIRDEGGLSSEQSTWESGEAAADTGAAPVPGALIGIVIAVILAILAVVAAITVIIHLIYRRRRQKNYPVEEKRRRSSRDFSETTRLQMSNLDDSGSGYNSTVGDPLNSSNKHPL